MDSIHDVYQKEETKNTIKEVIAKEGIVHLQQFFNEKTYREIEETLIQLLSNYTSQKHTSHKNTNSPKQRSQMISEKTCNHYLSLSKIFLIEI